MLPPRGRRQQVAHVKGCCSSAARLALHTAFILADVHTTPGYSGVTCPAPPDEPLTLKPYVPEIIHNIQYRPPPQRLHLHRSDNEILTNFDEDVSSIRDGFTAWVGSNAAETRSRHFANSSPSGTAPVFRKASEKKSMSQLLEYQFDNRKPNRQQEQTRISILSWSSGPRRGRGTPVLLRNKLRVNGTLLLCKNPSNSCSTNTLPTHFYVSHFAGCAILYDKDTISSDLLGSSVYIHDRKSGQHVVKEGQNGWVLQAVISRGMVRRTPRNGKPHFTMMSLHINNSHAKKRGIAKNVPVAVRTAVQQVDMIAGVFNCAAMRRKRGESHQCVRTIEEAFANTQPASTLAVLHPCGDPVASQTNGQTCAGGSETEWQIRMHGAHEINREVLGIKPTDQSCHHEVWIRLLHVTAWQVIRERKGSAMTERQDWRPYAKKKGQTHGTSYDHP